MQLSDFLGDVKDFTDPSCMERLLIYLEDLQQENEEFMTLLIETLEGETVYWEQPWYQLPAPITRPLKMVELQEGQDPYRTDSFTKAENNIIDKNWRKFVKKYKVPDKPKCFASWRNNKGTKTVTAPEERVRQFVVAYLARGLERSLCQVYRHFVTLYGAPNKGPYSETELKIMDVCFYHFEDKAVVYLSQILAREPRGILKRLSQIYTGAIGKKRKCWTLELASKLLNSLMQHSGLPLKKLKDKTFPKDVWLEAQKEIDQYYIYLMEFWYTYLHVQLFVKCDVKLHRLRKKILIILGRYPYEIWTDINWKQVLNHFPSGFTHQFIHRVAYRLVKGYPGLLHAPLDKVISYARDKIKSFANRRLRTLKYKDGELEIARYKNQFVLQSI